MKKCIKALMIFMGIIIFCSLNPISAHAEWKLDSNGWWYSEGASWSVGWREINGEWYYFDKTGYMMTGWIEDNDKTYFLNDDGSMAHECTVEGKKLGKDGAWIEDNSKPKMTKDSFKASDNTTMGYWLYSPKNADSNKKLPLIIYLHGYWGENTNTDMVIKNEGLPKFLYENTTEVPAYVLCPCCEKAGWASYFIAIKELIDDLEVKGIIDPDRISITGHSMGGFGTWLAAVAYPDLFSCIAPVSGYMVVDGIEQTQLNSIPVWAFVGDKDTTVDPKYAVDSVNKLKELGGNAKLTVIKGAAHNDTANLVYLDKNYDVLNWMISQTKKAK